DTRGVYYDDGQADTSGLADYAIIGDLNQAKGDKIQLLGNADSYRLGSTPSSTTSGTAIFLKTSVQDELIAIVKGDSNLSLQSSAFQFV
ncbi:MAG: type I secretion protein, partial [Cyanobacteria bacterium J06588_5]